MRRLGVLLVAGLLCFSGVVLGVPLRYAQVGEAAQRQEIAYVGSARSNKYHYPTCVWARKIKPSNLVGFSSPEEAQRSGYVPCKVCRPPLQSTR